MKKNNSIICFCSIILCVSLILGSCALPFDLFGEETTSSPDTTKAPETTESPDTTEAPGTTESPHTTEAPDTTEPPDTTEAPDTTEPPDTTEVPPETTVPADETTSPIDDEPQTPKKRIAFTFDDGPHFKTTPLFLDKLEQLGAKATFFVAGYKAVMTDADKNIKRMSDIGCEIGNHSYSHGLFSNLTESQIAEEVESVNLLVEKITGTRPTLLRPPYGEIKKDIAIRLGMHIIHWSVDPEDWKYRDAQTVADHIISKAKDGDIILMHDIYQSSYEAFCIAADALIADGFELVTISELLDLNEETVSSGVVHKSVTKKK